MPVLAMNQAAVQSIYDAVTTHLERCGVLDRKPLSNEPMSASGRGLSCAFTGSRIAPIRSGLSATSCRWELILRLYHPWQDSMNQRAIDVKLDAAAFSIFAEFSGDINLTSAGAAAGLVRGFQALLPINEPRWLEMNDGSRFRVRDLSIAIDINDCFTQAGA